MWGQPDPLVSRESGSVPARLTDVLSGELVSEGAPARFSWGQLATASLGE